jgi:glycosidase
MLVRLGVAGFRIDAAKHMQQVELDDIIARVNTPRPRRRSRCPTSSSR